MRLASLAVVVLCVTGVALAAPQLATDQSPLSAAFGDGSGDGDDPDYGPVEGSYFRAASYDRYTGTGWERTTPRGSAPTDLAGPRGPAETVRIDVEARSRVRTLPAPWRPTAYEGPEASVSAGSLEPVEPLEPGDRFSLTARRPVWTQSDLRSAGTDYPAAVEDQYTRLPATTPDELGSTAAEVTADAETPYGTAVAINRWLRTEKNYSLTVDRPREYVAASFATEMDAGFCQYFATTMAAMLRAEGVPARYVTGYSPYEQVGPGEHVIRGKYAHAWVEAYFPGVGWVPFDPTPPTERESARGLETPGTRSGADSDDEVAYRSVARPLSIQSDGWQQLAADVEVDEEPSPGRDLTVRIEDPDDGAPIDGAQVRFNGRPVGETDDRGELVAQVPYAEELRVTAHVYEGEGEPPPVDGVGGAGTGGPAASGDFRDLRHAAPQTRIAGSLTGLSDEVLFRATVQEGSVLRRGEPGSAVDGPDPDEPEEAGDAADGRPAIGLGPRSGSVDAISAVEDVERIRLEPAGAERRFDLETAIDVSVAPADGRRPGDQMQVAATLDGRPVPNATVTAGEATATTNAEGLARIPTPYERPATVVVERGAAGGEATVPVGGRLEVEVDADTDVDAEANADADASATDGWSAGAPVAVTATVDGRPVPEATVTNGVETATTDAEGGASIPAPYRSPGEITVERGDFAGTVEAPVAIDDASVAVDDPVPGGRVLVRGAVGGEPIRNAVVSVDGTAAGETDGVGRGRVAVPYRESITVAVARGDVRAERTVDVPIDATVAIEGRAIPGGSVDVLATVEGRPIENATVLRGGSTVARTDADGRATVDVPLLASGLGLRVERGAVSGETSASGLWAYWAALFGALGVVAVAAWRRGYLGRLSRLSSDPMGPLSELVAAVGSIVEGVRADLQRMLATRNAGAGPPPDEGGDNGADPAFLVEPSTDNGVYRSWAALADDLGGAHRTPAAVADSAVEAGLPAEPVGELTDLFRAVRYGDAEPTEERERRAEAALSRIREATR